MKIKTRLTLGLGFLFANIVLLAVLGARQINILAGDTKNILAANYNTLSYTRQMMMALDEFRTDTLSVNTFLSNLVKQQNNITEKGEREATGQLTEHFQRLLIDRSDIQLQKMVRKDLYEIMHLNMQAIERKSKIAEETANRSTRWLVIAGTVCFIFSLTLLVNLPGAIANPIRELTNSIKRIADKHYKERVNFKSSSEFGELAEAFNTMAAKLEEYDNSSLARLLVEKKRIETLINKLHHPVIGLDDKKTVVFANGEALNVLGLKANYMIGRSANEISVTNDLMRSLLQNMASTESDDHHKPLKIYANNKESYFEKDIIPITITPTGEKQSRDIGHVIILQNITPFKELDSAKTNFIATISHELKTPISSIKMSLQLLEDERVGKANEEQKKLIASIQEDSERLLKITGELLNLSQVETGNIQLSIQQSNPKEILHYAVGAVKFQAEQKRVLLDIKLQEGLPSVKADVEKTAWVLINMLTNAIRYSPEDKEIVVEVRQEQSEIEFSVKDFGQGIDRKYTDRIFDRYFQVPGSSKSGTGLGLAISKEFIEAQDGKIGLESQIGEGSRFYFRLKVV
jgi:signal transduction histidine kinase